MREIPVRYRRNAQLYGVGRGEQINAREKEQFPTNCVVLNGTEQNNSPAPVEPIAT